MRKYISFFIMRLQVGLQYRAAFISGLVTQLPWGLMECLAYQALSESNAGAMPMEYSALVSYMWLRQAFFVMFNTWATDNDIFDMIMNGGIAYELCRPVSIYNMWFARNIGGRISATALRFWPILLVAGFLPEPYNLKPPKDITCIVMFLVTMVLALCVTVAFCMLVYMLCFFTISPQGVRMVLTGAVEFLSGSLIPIPFMPLAVRNVIELLPFASMHNVPLRIYSGDLAGEEMLRAVLLQIVWIVILVGLGKGLCKIAERRVVVQGG